MALDTLFALGLLCTTATQLRFVGPLGPGDVFLVLWGGLTFLRLMMERRPLLTRPLSEMLAFWAIFVSTLCVGTIIGLATHERYDPVWFMHDVFAYSLLLIVTTFSLAGEDAGARLRRTGWALAVLGSFALAVQVAAGYGMPIGLFHPWFWERFRGWSDNPNQLAFTCAGLMLLAAFLAASAATTAGRVLALCCLPLPVLVGRLTQSDTFLLTALITVPLFLIIKIRSWAERPRRGGLRGPLAVLIVLSVPVLIIAAAPIMMRDDSGGAKGALALTKGGGKEVTQEADLRFMLWRQAIARTISTAGLGLGPGPHLQIPAEIVLAHDSDENGIANTVHPQDTGAMNFEAHNTILDLATQGGVVGVLAFIWLQGAAIVRAWQARAAGLVALLGGLLLFGMTNLIVRQPLLWYAVALCLTVRAAPAAARVVAAHSRTRVPVQ